MLLPQKKLDNRISKAELVKCTQCTKSIYFLSVCVVSVGGKKKSNCHDHFFCNCRFFVRECLGCFLCGVVLLFCVVFLCRDTNLCCFCRLMWFVSFLCGGKRHKYIVYIPLHDEFLCVNTNPLLVFVLRNYEKTNFHPPQNLYFFF